MGSSGAERATAKDPFPRGGVMKAKTGDRLVIRGHRIGERERDGEIVEVHGKDGRPAVSGSLVKRRSGRPRVPRTGTRDDRASGGSYEAGT